MSFLRVFASMILECPECGTRYLVPDSAIGAEGRVVRCIQCRHSWYQDPPELVLPAPAVGADVLAGTPDDLEPVSPVAVPEIEPEPQSEPPPRPALREAAPTSRAVRPARGGRARTLASLAAGLLMLAAIAVILWTTAPGLAQRVGLSIGPDQLPLRIVDNPIERRKMANGSELFAVSGQVTNPSPTRQRIPDIRADLRDKDNKVVFTWTITPQARTIAPGAALDFNSAQVDVPASSKRLDLSFVGEDG